MHCIKIILQVYLDLSFCLVNCKFQRNFFICFFGCLKANFGPMSRKQPHSTVTNHWLFCSSFDQRHQEPCNRVSSLNLIERLVEFEPATLQLLLNTLTLSCMSLKNGQTYFNNLVVNNKNFWSMFGYFSTICTRGLTHYLGDDFIS